MNTKGFSTLVTGMSTAVQAKAAGLVDFTIGSILRAATEAFAQVALWLQGLVLGLLATTRASTSTGSDLDSFIADYGLTRLQAVAASGQVTLSRFTSSAPGFAAIGGLVSTGDGSQQFAIVADLSNPAYSSQRGGYVLDAGTSSVTVPVRASIAGAAGNVAAGAISLIVSEIDGIDTASNAAAFAGGQDAETDAAVRLRFRAYLRSLRTSNDGSIEYAVANVQAGLRFAIVRNKTYPEQRELGGYFFIAVDDGSGAPPQSLLNAVFDAVSAVRGCGIQFGVFGPSVVDVDASLTLNVNSATDYAPAVSAAYDAVVAYINAMTMAEQTLALTRIAQIAYDSYPAITNVTNVMINGVAADLALTAFQFPKARTVMVS
jgi:uncharacterized phage protein gp47/JayE